ncbi:MAG TPA: peptidoglycan-binding domain-containing protein [Candidatus Limnocylindrales bacterium]|nr:peptidoglycan-binding domain-containing protein [Candidatus Limnocylindrales bacterium]
MTRLILAAIAVGGLSLPAAGAAQTTAGARKTTHKPVTGTTSAKTTTGTAKKSSKAGKRSSSKSKRVKGQAAPTADRINEIQGALAKNGAYTGEPSGKWDDSTVEAMRKFQASHGLNPTGKMDALTLQKLGLGSGTAGMGVPTPPPNSSNRLLSSKVQRDEVKSEPE